MTNILSRLSAVAQNSRFDGLRDTDDATFDISDKERKRKNWEVLGADIIFNENLGLEAKNIYDLSEEIEMCIRNNKPIVIELKGLKIVLNAKKHECVSFFGKNYRVTVDGDDIYSEVDVIKMNLDAHLAKRYDQGCKTDIPVKVSQTITVINGEEISEVCDIDCQDGLVDRDRILEKFKRYNSDYSEALDEGKVVLYRLISDYDEVIRKPNAYRGVYIDASKANRAERVKGFNTYSDLIPVAVAREERCKYIYSLVMRAYEKANERITPFGGLKPLTKENTSATKKQPEKVFVKNNE